MKSGLREPQLYNEDQFQKKIYQPQQSATRRIPCNGYSHSTRNTIRLLTMIIREAGLPTCEKRHRQTPTFTEVIT